MLIYDYQWTEYILCHLHMPFYELYFGIIFLFIRILLEKFGLIQMILVTLREIIRTVFVLQKTKVVHMYFKESMNLKK